MVKIDNLFDLLQQRGISQKKLSDDTGISTGNISDWKSGRSVPSADKLNILADYLDCSVDYLLGRLQIIKNKEEVIVKNSEYFIGNVKIENKTILKNIEEACEANGDMVYDDIIGNHISEQFIQKCNLPSTFVEDMKRNRIVLSYMQLATIATEIGYSVYDLLDIPYEPTVKSIKTASENKGKIKLKSFHNLNRLLSPLLNEQHYITKLGFNKKVFENWKLKNEPIYKNILILIALHFKVSLDYIVGNTDFSEESNKNICGLVKTCIETKKLHNSFPRETREKIFDGSYLFTEESLSIYAQMLGVTPAVLLQDTENKYKNVIKMEREENYKAIAHGATETEDTQPPIEELET